MVEGSTRASDGSSRLDAIPVFALSDSRSKTAIPVCSLPVPLVVGHAMCGLSGPGTGAGAHGLVDVGEEVRGVGGVQVRGLAGVDDGSAAHGDVAVEAALGGEACRVSRNDASVGSTCVSV